MLGSIRPLCISGPTTAPSPAIAWQGIATKYSSGLLETVDELLSVLAECWRTCQRRAAPN